jgi:rubrerythrin
MKTFKLGLLLILGLSLAACSTETVESEEVVAVTETETTSETEEHEATETGQGNKGGNSTIEIDWSLKPEVNVTFEEDYSLGEMLNLAIEDEYHAKNTYVAIVDDFGDVSPFNAIIDAELSHIESLKLVFEDHGFVLPEDPNSIESVPADLNSALEAAIQAEVNNIAMYEHFLSLSDEEDVIAAFELLKAASESHLESFMMSLQRQSTE